VEREELPPHMTRVPTEEIRRVNTPKLDFFMIFFVYFMLPCSGTHLRQYNAVTWSFIAKVPIIVVY